ncbi:hypothetical protein VHEMI01548 [[Torrubiella] hemipterigena]|uniref:Anaphase-promoting complex subunit 4 n=1 Tax=[Torrubiella] hemipterigena TaxID=1531966 RepID=A0A0A1T7T3_9HYPO|nr:hypothetical protein VHEMI01548 [[Torrubiella] hemipterigena]
MAQDASLSQHSETSFDFKATAGYPVGNPALDLCTAWDAAGRNLYIYRPGGQVVSKIHQYSAPGSKAPDALTVTWKPDGQFLAVGWSDGVVRLMGLENNKTVHNIPITDGEGKISHIGWATAVIVDKAAASISKKLERLMADEEDAEHVLDLPEEIKFLEIDTALPKISPLPTGSAGAGDDATVFTLRSGIDFLFQPPKRSDHGRVNAMITGTTDGKLHLSVYDSFVIGSLHCPTLETARAPRMISHAWNPRFSTQALLLTDDEGEPSNVHLVPIDLPFISASPINLSLLASKMTTLQTLLRYFKQVQLHMQVEWNNARELPKRFLRSVQEDLQQLESGPKDIISALYHTVATGHAYPPVKEWLVDTLAERGHKRWDKAVVSGLENLRCLVHENFLPSLDRAAIILSRLRGLARYHALRDDLGFNVAQLNRILDIISCLSLVGNKILLQVMDELDHFHAFSAWLRFQIDKLGASSSAADELTEKEATLQTGKILTYIERYLVGSPLDGYFGEIAKEDYSADWDHIEDGPSLLAVLDKQLQKRDEGVAHMKALPHVDFLVNYATTWANRMFKDVAEAKLRSVRFGKPVKLGMGAVIHCLDVKMLDDADGVNVFAAMASKEITGKISLFKMPMTIVNGISTNKEPSMLTVALPDRRILDIKFLRTDLVILTTKPSSNEAQLLSIPASTLTYAPNDDALEVDIANLSPTTYTMPADMNIRPVKLETHEKVDLRGEIPARISLLSANRTTVTTLAID